MGRGNIDFVCESLIKDLVVGMGLRLVGDAYERLTGVVCCPQELAGPRGGSLFRIKASNIRASKIQKIRKYYQFGGQPVKGSSDHHRCERGRRMDFLQVWWWLPLRKIFWCPLVWMLNPWKASVFAKNRLFILQVLSLL